MKPVFSRADAELLALDKETAAAKTLDMTRDWDLSFEVLFERHDIGQSFYIEDVECALRIIGLGERQEGHGDAAHAISPTRLVSRLRLR